ncbi:hypothetical protein [Cryptosporangium minutisporangium]|uniref:Uncharacterized protein n=1 Tax=Cryptosporangium minutisporangium TaxID=113569 RepID=A0ABP6T913_9ACTN
MAGALPAETRHAEVAPGGSASALPAALGNDGAAPRLLSLTGLAPRGRLIDTIGRHVPGSIDPTAQRNWAEAHQHDRRVAAGLGALVVATLLLTVILPGSGSAQRSVAGSFTPHSAPRSYSTAIDSPLPPVYSETPSAPTAPDEGSSGVVSGIPGSTYDYAAVCDGTVFPDAPAYTGPPRHYVYVDVEARGHEAEYYLGDLSAWESDTPSEIQLVACVQYTLGSVIGSCRYQGTGGKVLTQTLRNATYEVWVRSARTGQMVGHSRFRGSVRSCEETIVTFGGRAPSIQITRPSLAQLRSSIGRYVTG